jgi:RNA polymerase sigma-70 factor (ECF subfamily)
MSERDISDNHPPQESDGFSAYRSLLFAIAYRMLGSVMDAEDIVQDAFLRWQQHDPSRVSSPKSYLTATVTNLCIDHLRLARVQREQYVGPWVPEPLIADEDSVDADPVVLAESLSLAFLSLLEHLSPVERAVFLLHEVFGYPFDEIAAIVGKSNANCRQIAQRARKRLHGSRPRFTPVREEHERLTHQFMDACLSGDLSAFLAILADDVTLYADGGGKVTAARRPVYGGDRVARFLVGICTNAPPSVAVQLVPVNGQLALVCEAEGHLASVFTLDVMDGHIQTIRVILNPEKFHGLAPAHGMGSPKDMTAQP